MDDDESVRESLPDLLRALGFEAHSYRSAEAFLASAQRTHARCVLLDVALPGMSGPELHRELVRGGDATPVVYITAQADDGLRQRLRAQGAVDCLFKPFGERELRAALGAALSTP